MSRFLHSRQSKEGTCSWIPCTSEPRWAGAADRRWLEIRQAVPVSLAREYPCLTHAFWREDICRKVFSAAMKGLVWQFAARDHSEMLSGPGRTHYVVVTEDKLKAAGRHPTGYVNKQRPVRLRGAGDDGKVDFVRRCEDKRRHQDIYWSKRDEVKDGKR